MKQHIATIATKSTWKEFLLMKFSLEEMGEKENYEWFISCDEFVKKEIEKMNENNIHAFHLIETDEANHNSTSKEKQENWMKVMMTKFDVVEKALLFEENDFGVFLLDNDMLFVNELPLLPDLLNFSAGLCPHWTNNLQIENQFGFYNAGMVFVSSWDFLQDWKRLSQNYKQLGLYYEQQPLEFVARNYFTMNLPINYDIGWWRFNQPNTKQRLNQLHLKDDYIYFGKLPAINFHLHLLKENNVKKDGLELKEKVFELMKQSNNPHYHKILEKYEELSK